MSSLRNRGLLALLVASLMAGCGTPATTARATTATASKTSAPIMAYDAAVGAETNMENLNDSGELDAITDEDFASFDETEAVSADKTVMAASAKPKNVTKCGFVRTNTDGKFFLQITKGFLWWKRESSVPLLSTDENTGLKIAEDLNKKVILRGPLQGETVVVSKIHKLLDFGKVWDLLSKGSVGGKAYDSRTKVGLSFAEITVKSFATGRISRTKTDKAGDFSVGRLEAGEYEVSAKSADFNLGAKDKITVKKRSSAKVNLGLTAQGSGAIPPTTN